jgi:hypothetical protein
MIEKKFVEKEARKILKDQNTTERTFLSQSAPKLVNNVLLKQPHDFWNNFGMYWWNLETILREYAPKDFRKFVQSIGGEDFLGRDDDTKKQYDYGTDMFNWVAALSYLEWRADNYQTGGGNVHTTTDNKGNERDYVPSIGFVD